MPLITGRFFGDTQIHFDTCLISEVADRMLYGFNF